MVSIFWEDKPTQNQSWAEREKVSFMEENLKLSYSVNKYIASVKLTFYNYNCNRVAR